MQINVLEAKNRFSELIRAVEDGGEVTIAKRGRPVARLVSVNVNRPSLEGKVGDAATILAYLAAHPRPAYAQRSHEEIEATIAEAREWD